ncbi:ATP-binding cassette domain-containing protein [Vibrio splendidus]|uniref:ATP-binding cassette domain-containing protein n=1 Tax=Vibrio splendidus TaxID=29497 RepID=UPI003D0A5ED1
MIKYFKPLRFQKEIDLDAKKPLNKELFFANSGEIIFVLFLSFLINLMLLALPYYIRHVYNDAIPSESVDVLMILSTGLFLVLSFSFILYLVRAAFMTGVGRAVGKKCGDKAFELTVKSPLLQFLMVKPNVYIFRFFRNARIGEFFASTSGIAFFDLPFVFIFIISVFFLGGALALVPIAAIGVYWLVIVIFDRIRSRAYSASNVAAMRKYDLEHLFASQITPLSRSGMSEYWLEELEKISKDVAINSLKLARISAAYQSVTHMLSMFTALATLAVGIGLLLNGTLDAGGLIASMMLIWRITSPLQAAGASFAGFEIVRDTICSLMQQLRTPTDETPEALVTDIPKSQKGWALSLENVLFRYDNDRDAAFSALTFNLDAGDVLAITGSNGGGKSTVFDLLCRFYDVQNGKITVNGKNIKQFQTQDWRAEISLITRLEDDLSNLKSLIFWDVPTLTDSVTQQEKFLALIEANRKTATQIFISNNPVVINDASKVLVLEKGEVSYFGELGQDAGADIEITEAEIVEEEKVND